METLEKPIFTDAHDEEYGIFDTMSDEEKAMPSLIHGWIQKRLMNILDRVIQRGYAVLPPITFKVTEKGYAPDICVYAANELHLDVIDVNPTLNIAPILAVEIVSISQGMVEIIRKANEMMKAGVETCWVIEPAAGIVIVCTAKGRVSLHAGEFLHHPLLSDPISIDEIFDLTV
ncbi:MAG: Uma2 family endonuclease [Candidatus Kapaibacterium sp.]|nr:MAG: Uma2 family endonuclease [Candidatus Kapabacteria bacterium]